MVLLTITPTILEALKETQHPNGAASQDLPRSQIWRHSLVEEDEKHPDARDGKDNSQQGHSNKEYTHEGIRGRDSGLDDPLLQNPKLGNPISHGQIIDLWKRLKGRGTRPRTLDSLLKGSRIYHPPPKPKPEPTSEYKALMAKLRREEEERSYHRMTNPEPVMETFAQRFPLSSAAHAFASSHQPIGISDPDDDDEVTYEDVNRQVTLILNVLVSIVACAAAIWVVAKWWSTPARLAVSLAGSLLVGVAEVVVYSGYIRRVREAKKKEKSIKEVKNVVNTWVVGVGEAGEAGETGVEMDTADNPTYSNGREKDDSSKARRRKKDGK